MVLGNDQAATLDEACVIRATGVVRAARTTRCRYSVVTTGASMHVVAHALIFDLDGTLVDSVADIGAALAAAMIDHGLAAPSLAQVRDWIGGGARTLIQHAIEHEIARGHIAGSSAGAAPHAVISTDAAVAAHDRIATGERIVSDTTDNARGPRALPTGEPLVDAVLASFGLHYESAPIVHSRLYDGIGPALDRLASTHLLAVLSNKPHSLVVQICERLLAPWPFRVVMGQRPGGPLKPDPAAALEIASALGVAPGDCIVVGDSPSDLATARAAGMRSVAVTWGYRPRDELVASQPTCVLDDPSALASLADGM